MDETIDRRFERVEKALATLITSISTYNPAPALANDLVTADAELSQGLEQLSTHQSNHAKILSLRTTSQDLDARIKETLTLLTSTRTALLTTPSTIPSASPHPVSYSDLLSYARRISKFTLPSSFRETEQPTGVETGEATTNTPGEIKSGTQTNSASTPVTGAHIKNGVEKTDNTAMDIDSTTMQPSSALPAQWLEYLNPPPNAFLPWLSEETIRRGALASIQILVDKGIDPADFDPAKSAELEAERKRKVEEEDRAREAEKEERRRMSVGAGGEVRMQGQGQVPEKAKAFQLETFDEDDDDD